MAQVQVQTEVETLTIEHVVFDAALSAYRAEREARDAGLVAGEDAKESLTAYLNVTMWASVDYIATKPEDERAESAATLAEMIAEAGQQSRTNARQTKSRLGKAVGAYLSEVVAASPDERAKAGPHSIVAKLERKAKKAAEITAIAEAAEDEANRYNIPAYNLICATLGHAEAAEIMLTTKRPNERADWIKRTKQREHLIAEFGDWRSRAELRGWLEDFAEADEAAKAEAVAEAAKYDASLQHARESIVDIHEKTKADKAAAKAAAEALED